MEFKITNSLSRDNLNYKMGTVKNIHYGDIHTKFQTLFDVNKESVPFINKEINIDRISSENYCREGDILFADASEDLNDVGKSIEVVNLNDEKVLSGLHTLLARPKPGIFDIGFGGYLFKSDLVRAQIKKQAQGSKVLSVSTSRLLKVILSIPKIQEQRKITTLMSLLEARIQTQSKIIEKLETLIKEVCQNLFKNPKSKNWSKLYMRDVLIERREYNKLIYPVHSVSVKKGVINQIEYLGRSFAAKNTSNYNVVHYGDIVYTKSPTGDFPFGIIKQSFIKEKVAVSPLYGVYMPKNMFLGNILHYYFSDPSNAKKYLHSLIQKGAKNTINITNQNFLNKELYLPHDEKEIYAISSLFSKVAEKSRIEQAILDKLIVQKSHLLQNLFI